MCHAYKMLQVPELFSFTRYGSRSRLIDCKVEDKGSLKEFVDMQQYSSVQRYWAKQAVIQQILNFKVLIRRDLPKKTEKTVTCVS